MLAEFPSAVDAARGGLAIQTELAWRNADLPEDSRIAIRIGINRGDAIIDGNDVHGKRNVKAGAETA